MIQKSFPDQDQGKLSPVDSAKGLRTASFRLTEKDDPGLRRWPHLSAAVLQLHRRPLGARQACGEFTDSLRGEYDALLGYTFHAVGKRARGSSATKKSQKRRSRRIPPRRLSKRPIIAGVRGFPRRTTNLRFFDGIDVSLGGNRRTGAFPQGDTAFLKKGLENINSAVEQVFCNLSLRSTSIRLPRCFLPPAPKRQTR